VTVIVLAVTPEKLRGELTRWLLEIAAGVYVGHIPARVRELLWARVVEDVGKGRALMVWSRRGEQRLDFRAHNHGWTPEDYDGLTLMRRVTAESRALTVAREARASKLHGASVQSRPTDDGDSRAAELRHWSDAGRRRAYRSVVEQRRTLGASPGDAGRSADDGGSSTD
jgi:CRISPR-associated protein Cas2